MLDFVLIEQAIDCTFFKKQVVCMTTLQEIVINKAPSDMIKVSNSLY